IGCGPARCAKVRTWRGRGGRPPPIRPDRPMSAAGTSLLAGCPKHRVRIGQASSMRPWSRSRGHRAAITSTVGPLRGMWYDFGDDYGSREIRTQMDTERLFSIGHSSHDLGSFLRILRRAGVTAVADVRSQPFSQRWPQFNRAELEQALRAEEML